MNDPIHQSTNRRHFLDGSMSFLQRVCDRPFVLSEWTFPDSLCEPSGIGVGLELKGLCGGFLILDFNIQFLNLLHSSLSFPDPFLRKYDDIALESADMIIGNGLLSIELDGHFCESACQIIESPSLCQSFEGYVRDLSNYEIHKSSIGDGLFLSMVIYFIVLK